MQMEPQQQDAPTGPEHITDESKKLDTLDLELRSIEDKSVGCLLGCMFGDAIGAAVEGHLAKDIREEFPLGLTRYVPRSHMGVYQLGPRRGMYTDDSQCMLALLSSLVSNKGLDPEDCAMSYALFFQHKPLRGYPRSAQMVFKGLLGGVSYTNTGRIAFKDGSYANGGCMRIHPVGVAFRNATNDELYEAVRLAIISSHVHPCGIDGAFVQAKTIATLIHIKEPQQLDVAQLLQTLLDACRTEELKKKLTAVMDSWQTIELDDYEAEEKFLATISEPFQIEAIEAVSVALFALARYWKTPVIAISKIIGFGGDTDTTACMLGAMLGALYGTTCFPFAWYDQLENGEYGRDFCVGLAKELATLDLHVPLKTPPAGDVQ